MPNRSIHHAIFKSLEWNHQKFSSPSWEATPAIPFALCQCWGHFDCLNHLVEARWKASSNWQPRWRRREVSGKDSKQHLCGRPTQNGIRRLCFHTSTFRATQPHVTSRWVKVRVGRAGSVFSWRMHHGHPPVHRSKACDRSSRGSCPQPHIPRPAKKCPAGTSMRKNAGKHSACTRTHWFL